MTETPDQKHLKIRKALKDAAPTFEKMAKMSEAERVRWENEIESLQERVKTAHVDVDLGDGKTIAVRTALLDAEVNRLAVLEDLSAKETDKKKSISYICESIAIITANPLITKEWLLKNQDKYSPGDLLTVLLGYMEVRLKEQQKQLQQVRSASTFRPKPTGAELR